MNTGWPVLWIPAPVSVTVFLAYWQPACSCWASSSARVSSPARAIAWASGYEPTGGTARQAVSLKRSVKRRNSKWTDVLLKITEYCGIYWEYIHTSECLTVLLYFPYYKNIVVTLDLCTYQYLDAQYTSKHIFEIILNMLLLYILNCQKIRSIHPHRLTSDGRKGPYCLWLTLLFQWTVNFNHQNAPRNRLVSQYLL